MRRAPTTRFKRRSLSRPARRTSALDAPGRLGKPSRAIRRALARSGRQVQDSRSPSLSRYRGRDAGRGPQSASAWPVGAQNGSRGSSAMRTMTSSAGVRVRDLGGGWARRAPDPGQPDGLPGVPLAPDAARTGPRRGFPAQSTQPVPGHWSALDAISKARQPTGSLWSRQARPTEMPTSPVGVAGMTSGFRDRHCRVGGASVPRSAPSCDPSGRATGDASWIFHPRRR